MGFSFDAPVYQPLCHTKNSHAPPHARRTTITNSFCTLSCTLYTAAHLLLNENQSALGQPQKLFVVFCVLFQLWKKENHLDKELLRQRVSRLTWQKHPQHRREFLASRPPPPLASISSWNLAAYCCCPRLRLFPPLRLLTKARTFEGFPHRPAEKANAESIRAS